MEIKADLFSEVELKYNSKNGESQVTGILNPSAKKDSPQLNYQMVTIFLSKMMT